LYNQELEQKVRERTADVEKNEKKFRTLIESSHDGIGMLNERGEIIYATASTKKIDGFSLDEIAGRIGMGHVHPEDMPHVVRLMEEVFKNPGKPVYSQHRIQHKDGHWVWTEGTMTNFLHEPAVNALVVNFRDITARKEAELEIMNLNKTLEQKVIERTAQLENANKELESFSYSVSHDLRAPLRAVYGFSAILMEDQSGRLDDEGKRMLDIVLQNTRRMGQLIDDLLAFSRLSRKEMMQTEINMEAIVNEAVRDQPKEWTSKALCEVKPLPPAPGDPALIKQVWSNLISNAFKYSSKSEHPRIEIGSLEESGNTVYYVKDNGAGFDMNYAGKLFGVFQRLHTEDEFEGTGVGLAIVNRIVVRHNGKVWASATPGAGATFYFYLKSPDHGTT
jgi:PAS domain S-box-containing protein